MIYIKKVRNFYLTPLMTFSLVNIWEEEYLDRLLWLLSRATKNVDSL